MKFTSPMNQLTIYKHRVFFLLSLASSDLCLLTSALYNCREASTNHPFLCKTNPILSAVGGLQMNVTSIITKDYENKSNWTLGENEPNTNPNEPKRTQLKPIKCQNEPNTNPILPASGGFIRHTLGEGGFKT